MQSSSTVALSQSSKAFMLMIFPISLSITSLQSNVPLASSISKASFTECGRRTPYLCVVRQYLPFIFDIILFLFLKTSVTHHAKAGSSLILFQTAYSTSSTGLDFFKSFNVTQSDVLAFQFTNKCQP